jgi:hypothetical protein
MIRERCFPDSHIECNLRGMEDGITAQSPRLAGKRSPWLPVTLGSELLQKIIINKFVQR